MAPTYDEDGTQTNSISERQQKKRNLLLDPVKKHLTREDNVSPTSTYLKNQLRRNAEIERLLNQ